MAGRNRCSQSFLAWAQTRLSSSAFGDFNHSTRFIHEFFPSLAFATQTCTAGSLHSVLPAFGVPSLVSRVIDVVSVNGQSLLPVLHIYTNNQGVASWALLGCPCLEASKLDDEAAAADGANEIFGFHKAKRMVSAVHALESNIIFTVMIARPD